MDPNQFDMLSRSFASRRLSRRTALRRKSGTGLSAAAFAALGWRSAVGAQDATPIPSNLGENGSFLFVQTAQSGSLRPNPAAAGATPETGATPAAAPPSAYLLTLAGHNGETIYFSDRPQRIFGEAATDRLFAGFGFPPGNPRTPPSSPTRPSMRTTSSSSSCGTPPTTPGTGR
jgi:hypothetical protein